MLLMVCVWACWPFTCVMVVGEGCSGWCVFQYCVAVVCASRRVPGVGVCVSWLVPGACSGVGWLVVGACARVVGASVGVAWLVCVLWWFRILTCLASFFLLVLSFVLSCCLVNNGLPGCVGAGGCLLVGCLGWCGCVLVARRGVGWWLVVFAFVCGRVRVFCGRVKVCLSASCGLLGCCLCVGLAWCACGATGCCLACEGV